MPRAASLNRTKQAILGMLTLGPRSGYELRAEMQGSINYFWSESFGQIYPALHALERDGLVVEDAVALTGARSRRRYALTAAGREAFRAWLREPASRPVPRVELLLKLFFARELEAADVRAHLADFRDHHESVLERYAQLRSWLQSRKTSADPFWLLTLSYGEHLSRAMLVWCDEADSVVARALDATMSTDALPSDRSAPIHDHRLK